MKKILLGVAAAVILLVCCGGGVALLAAPNNPTPIGLSTSAPTTAPASTVTVPGRPGGIKDGEWLVGKDVPAGRYHSPGPADGLMCYWQKTTAPDAQPGEKTFITNDSPPGPSYVSLVAGQYFTTSHCGEWTRA